MPKFFRQNFNREIPEVSLTISAATFFKLIALAVLTIVILLVLKIVSHALLLIFIAFFLALALNAPVSWVGRHMPGRLRGKRGLATTISTFIVIVIIGAFLYLVVPPIVGQVKVLINQAPEIIQNIQNQKGGVGSFIAQHNLGSQVDHFAGQVKDRLTGISGNILSGLTTAIGSLVSILTILVLTFMMLVEGPEWLKLGRQLLPAGKRGWADEIGKDMYAVVRGYVNGQVLLAVIASFMLLPGLLIFHVSYPVALMAVVFVAGLIPMVGHTIGAIIVTIVALFTSPLSALGILIWYIIYQQIENYLITPRLQASTTNLSPLMVFVALVLGISFGGIIGGLIAIPFAGCVRVLTVDYLDSKNMLDSTQSKTVGKDKD